MLRRVVGAVSLGSFSSATCNLMLTRTLHSISKAQKTCYTLQCILQRSGNYRTELRSLQLATQRFVTRQVGNRGTIHAMFPCSLLSNGIALKVSGKIATGNSFLINHLGHIEFFIFVPLFGY